jgi:hypothetical protein
MSGTLGDIRLGKILDALEHCDAMVNERSRRLETYAKTNHVFRTHVDRAISITRECHSTAEKYHAIEDEVAQLASASSVAILDRVSTKTHHAAGARDSNEFLDGVNRKAREFLGAMVAGQYSDSEASLASELKAKYSEDPDLNLITIAVSTLWIAFDQQRKTAQVAIDAIRLSRILRGLLYAGVIGHYGGSLDRKQRFDSVKDLVVEVLLEFVPGAGIASKLVPLYRAWFDLESPPPDVDAAAQVLGYVETYVTLMEMWNLLMPPSMGLLETCKQILSGEPLETS